jgi:predicted nucleic acid-binding protein
VRVQKLEDEADLTHTMEIAHQENQTFHYAAYLQVAKRMGLTLVTEDKRRLKACEELVLVSRV